MRTLVKVTGKSKENMLLLRHFKGELEDSDFEVEESIVNTKLIEMLYRERKQLNIEKDIFHYQSQKVSEVAFMPVNRLITKNEIEDILVALTDVLPTGKFTSGPYLNQLEETLSIFLQKKFVIATSSGTDALMISLLASGINKGDEVIMPANSFASTENAVLSVGGVPVYVDIDPVTFCIDLERIEEGITPQTKFILPVHLYGKHAEMNSIRVIADQFNLIVVEDACQGIGLSNLGLHADITTLSFNPYKNFGVCGKAGAIATDDEEIANKCIQYSYHGFEKNVKNKKSLNYGFNSKMDNLQAAIGLQRIKHLSLNNFKRLFLADRYINTLYMLQQNGLIELPELKEDHVWHLFPIKIKEGNRDSVMNRLKEQFGVETDLYYPILSHKQNTALVKKKYRDVKLMNTEMAHSQLIHLPLYPGLTLEEQDRVMEGLVSVIK